MTFINLIKAELVMLYGEIKNYYLNYIFFNLSLLITFIGLFYTFSSQKTTSSLILLYGLVTWQMCTSAISYISYVVQDESMLGTLEQIFMTRTKVMEVFISKILVNCIFSVVKSSILFIICMYIFKVQNIVLKLGFKNILIILIVLATVLGFYIIGLMFGGLSFYFKRIQSICNVFTYGFLFFTGITISIDKLPRIIQIISYCVPMTWANKCIEQIVNTTAFNWNNLMWFGVVLIIYFIIGYFTFKYCINKAKDLGKLGQY